MQKYLIDKFVSGASVILFFSTISSHILMSAWELEDTVSGCLFSTRNDRSHAGLEAWKTLLWLRHIFQGNEGKYNFDLDDWTHPDKIVFELAVPKCAQKKKPAMLDTSNVESW